MMKKTFGHEVDDLLGHMAVAGQLSTGDGDEIAFRFPDLILP